MRDGAKKQKRRAKKHKVSKRATEPPKNTHEPHELRTGAWTGAQTQGNFRVLECEASCSNASDPRHHHQPPTETKAPTAPPPRCTHTCTRVLSSTSSPSSAHLASATPIHQHTTPKHTPLASTTHISTNAYTQRQHSLLHSYTTKHREREQPHSHASSLDAHRVPAATTTTSVEHLHVVTLLIDLSLPLNHKERHELQPERALVLRCTRFGLGRACCWC